MNNSYVDTFVIRTNNRLRILQTIFDNMVISRADIAKMLNMSKPAVNEHIDHLLESKIILELGEGSATDRGGRRPILLAPNNEYKYIIALDLNNSKPIIALGNISGMPVDRFFIDKHYDFSDLCEIVGDCIDKLIKRNNVEYSQIGVIAISTPGTVNTETGEIANNRNGGQQTINLKSYLHDRYNLPIIIENYVNMAAVGEEKFLKKENRNSFLFINCGYNLSSAIVINGKVCNGENYSAGDIGRCILSEDGLSAESKIAVPALIELISQIIAENDITTSLTPSNIKFIDILNAYTKKDEAVISALKKISKTLASVIINAVALLDVNTVVVGGEYADFKDLIIKEVKSYINSSNLVFKPEIIPTALTYAGGIIGCFEEGTNYIIENLQS